MKKELILTTAIIIFNLIACKDDVKDPPKPNEEELITTVELIFSNNSSSAIDTFTFSDPDGEGGNSPTKTDTIRLEANSMYALSIRFLDESGSSPIDITEEVKEEANEHLICYTTSGNCTISITDTDGNGLDLGLEAEISTKDAESSTFTIALKHQPDVKDGSCSVGETDVEVAFALRIQ